MAHQIFNLPPQQPLSSAGRILPGSKCYFYLTGTSTPADVYTTADLDVTHTQPLEADGGGRFATVYLDPTVTYKATVTDQNDVLLYTIDPVNDQLLSQTIIGEYLYPRTAAEISVAVTPESYAYLQGDIRRYGATTAASAATNAAAITAAITQAKAAGGSPVLVRDGEYNTETVTISSHTGNLLQVIFENACLVVGSATTCFAVTDCENILFDKPNIKSTAITAPGTSTNQRGFSITNSGRITIRHAYLHTLTYGIYWASSKTGLVTGAYPIPSIIDAPTIKNCAAGIYFAPSAEYVEVLGANVTDCTIYGLLSDAGNIKVNGGTYSGNDIGIVYDGSNSTNGDHGEIVGATVNHNNKCGIYLHDLDFSMLVTGNNIWAQIGSDFSTAPLDGAYGVYLSNVLCVQLSGNIIANNERNLGLNGVTSSIWADNIFISDDSRTTYNIHQVATVAVADGNIEGPNIFKNALLGGADNNDPNKLKTPSFSNSWANLGSNFRDVAYWKDPGGVVHLMGLAASGTINTAMFTLPGGYRPGESLVFACISNGAIARLQIDADGTVTPKDGNNAYFALDTVHFKAEA